MSKYRKDKQTIVPRSVKVINVTNADHDHDELYYTKAESDAKYYTKAEVDYLVTTFINTTHYTKTEIDALLLLKADA